MSGARLTRRVTVEGGKKVSEVISASSSYNPRRSVFERLGGVDQRSKPRDNYQPERCRNWLRDGHCLYGNNCKFLHGPYTDPKPRTKSVRSVVQGGSIDRSEDADDRPYHSRTRSLDSVDFDMEEARELQHKQKRHRSEEEPSDSPPKKPVKVKKRHTPKHGTGDDTDESATRKRKKKSHKKRDSSPLSASKPHSPKEGGDWSREGGQAKWEEQGELDYEKQLALEKRRQDLQRQLALMDEEDAAAEGDEWKGKEGRREREEEQQRKVPVIHSKLHPEPAVTPPTDTGSPSGAAPVVMKKKKKKKAEGEAKAKLKKGASPRRKEEVKKKTLQSADDEEFGKKDASAVEGERLRLKGTHSMSADDMDNPDQHLPKRATRDKHPLDEPHYFSPPVREEPDRKRPQGHLEEISRDRDDRGAKPRRRDDPPVEMIEPPARFPEEGRPRKPPHDQRGGLYDSRDQGYPRRDRGQDESRRDQSPSVVKRGPPPPPPDERGLPPDDRHRVDDSRPVERIRKRDIDAPRTPSPGRPPRGRQIAAEGVVERPFYGEDDRRRVGLKSRGPRTPPDEPFHDSIARDGRSARGSHEDSQPRPPRAPPLDDVRAFSPPADPPEANRNNRFSEREREIPRRQRDSEPILEQGYPDRACGEESYDRRNMRDDEPSRGRKPTEDYPRPRGRDESIDRERPKESREDDIVRPHEGREDNYPKGRYRDDRAEEMPRGRGREDPEFVRPRGRDERDDGRPPLRDDSRPPRDDGRPPLRDDNRPPRDAGRPPLREDGRTPRDDVRPPRDDIRTPRDEGRPPRDNGRPPRDDGRPPRDDGRPPRDDGRPPRDDGRPPRDDGRPPRDDGRPPRDDGRLPRDDGGPPLRDDMRPTRDDGRLPKDDGRLPRDDGRPPPRDDMRPPREDGRLPRDDSRLPRDDMRPPRDDGRLPRDDGRPPRDDMRPPRDDGRLPRDDGRLPREEGRLPRDDVRLPRDDGRLPRDDGRLPRDDGRLPRDDGQPPRDDGRLPRDDRDNRRPPDIDNRGRGRQERPGDRGRDAPRYGGTPGSEFHRRPSPSPPGPPRSAPFGPLRGRSPPRFDTDRRRSDEGFRGGHGRDNMGRGRGWRGRGGYNSPYDSRGKPGDTRRRTPPPVPPRPYDRDRGPIRPRDGPPGRGRGRGHPLDRGYRDQGASWDRRDASRDRGRPYDESRDRDRRPRDSPPLPGPGFRDQRAWDARRGSSPLRQPPSTSPPRRAPYEADREEPGRGRPIERDGRPVEGEPGWVFDENNPQARGVRKRARPTASSRSLSPFEPKKPRSLSGDIILDPGLPPGGLSPTSEAATRVQKGSTPSQKSPAGSKEGKKTKKKKESKKDGKGGRSPREGVPQEGVVEAGEAGGEEGRTAKKLKKEKKLKEKGAKKKSKKAAAAAAMAGDTAEVPNLEGAKAEDIAAPAPEEIPLGEPLQAPEGDEVVAKAGKKRKHGEGKDGEKSKKKKKKKHQPEVVVQPWADLEGDDEQSSAAEASRGTSDAARDKPESNTEGLSPTGVKLKDDKSQDEMFSDWSDDDSPGGGDDSWLDNSSEVPEERSKANDSARKSRDSSPAEAKPSVNDVYDPISDDEFEAMYTQSDEEGEGEEDGGAPKAPGAEDVDWSSIGLQDTGNKEKEPGAHLQRFTAGHVFSRIGISPALAGQRLTQLVQDACAKAGKGDARSGLFIPTEGPKCLGAYVAAAAARKRKREGLLSDLGPCRRAMCARRDLAIRKQLGRTSSKFGKLAMFSSSPTAPVDRELFQMSVALYRKESHTSDNCVRIVPSKVGSVVLSQAWL